MRPCPIRPKPRSTFSANCPTGLARTRWPPKDTGPGSRYWARAGGGARGARTTRAVNQRRSAPALGCRACRASIVRGGTRRFICTMSTAIPCVSRRKLFDPAPVLLRHVAKADLGPSLIQPPNGREQASLNTRADRRRNQSAAGPHTVPGQTSRKAPPARTRARPLAPEATCRAHRRPQCAGRLPRKSGPDRRARNRP